MLLFRRWCRPAWRPPLAAAFLAILLTNCGFQPLYGDNSSRRAGDLISDLAYVAVASIPDRTGQMVRNQLLDLLHPGGMAERPVFLLTVDLNEEREGLAFQQDDSATRFNLRLLARFKLVDTRNGMVLLQGRTRAIAAYNVVRSDYANLVSQRDARGRAANSVAEGIQSRIAAYFSGLGK